MSESTITENPCVSVVIPTYKRPRELKRALESVLSQSYGDVEVLVVDDNLPSSEYRAETIETVKAFQDHYQVPIHHLLNDISLGGAGARNRGIEAARGEFLAFLDDDDEWLPGKLEKQMTFFETLSEKVCGVDTGFMEIDEGKGTTKEVRPALRGEIFEFLLVKHKGRAPKLSSLVCRTKALREVGLFDASMPSRQDLDLYLRLARKYTFDFISEPLINKYIHSSDRITSNVKSKLKGFEIFYKKYYTDLSLRPRLHRIFLRKYGLWMLYDKRVGQGLSCLLKSLFPGKGK